MADLDDVLRMFSSLTRISQIEATTGPPAFRTVDLVEIAREVVELFDAAAEDKGAHLEVVGDGSRCWSPATATSCSTRSPTWWTTRSSMAARPAR